MEGLFLARNHIKLVIKNMERTPLSSMVEYVLGMKVSQLRQLNRLFQEVRNP